MLYGWEGNRRSGVALAMRHRLSGIPTYGLNGLGKGVEHPAYAPFGVLRHLYLYPRTVTHPSTIPGPGVEQLRKPTRYH